MRVFFLAFAALFASAVSSSGQVSKTANKYQTVYFEPLAASARGSFKAVGRDGVVQIDNGTIQFRSTRGQTIKLEFLNRKPSELRGENRLTSTSNYIIGHVSEWRSGVEHFAKLRQEVYEGIELVLYFDAHGRLSFDLILAPGVDTAQIELALPKDVLAEVDSVGDLKLSTGSDAIVVRHPTSFQEVLSRRIPVESRFAVEGELLRLEVGQYDTSLPLTIDPVIEYSTFVGGGSSAVGMSLSSQQDVFITGTTDTLNFPATPGVFRSSCSDVSSCHEIFVTKFSAAGELIFNTYIGGSSVDVVSAIATDSVGNVYLTGYATSVDFPFTPSAFSSGTGNPRTFIVKLASDGSRLLYSSLFSGTVNGGRQPHLFVDSQGSAYVALLANRDFYTTTNAFRRAPESPSAPYEPALLKLNPSGSDLVFSTFLGSSGGSVTALTVDPLGRPLVAIAPPNPQMNLLMLSQNGGSLEFSRAIPGSFSHIGTVLVHPYTRKIFLAGETYGGIPITPDAFQPTVRGQDAFLMRLANDGSSIEYSTYFGGTHCDSISKMVMDADSSLILVGGTSSHDFPVTTDAVKGQLESFNGSPCGRLGSRNETAPDGFIARFNQNNSLTFASYFGGRAGSDGIADAFATSSGKLIVAGTTTATDFPVSQGAFTRSLAGPSAAYWAELEGIAAIESENGNGQVRVVGSQRYDESNRRLLFDLKVIDTAFVGITGASCIWQALRSTGELVGAGELQFGTSSQRCTGSFSLSSALLPGVYNLLYRVTTDRGRQGETHARLTVRGNGAVEGSVRYAETNTPALGVQVAVFNNGSEGFWSHINRVFAGNVPSLQVLAASLPPLRTGMSDSEGKFAWSDLDAGVSVVLVADDGTDVQFSSPIYLRTGATQTVHMFLADPVSDLGIAKELRELQDAAAGVIESNANIMGSVGSRAVALRLFNGCASDTPDPDCPETGWRFISEKANGFAQEAISVTTEQILSGQHPPTWKAFFRGNNIPPADFLQTAGESLVSAAFTAGIQHAEFLFLTELSQQFRGNQAYGRKTASDFLALPNFSRPLGRITSAIETFRTNIPSTIDPAFDRLLAKKALAALSNRLKRVPSRASSLVFPMTSPELASWSKGFTFYTTEANANNFLREADRLETLRFLQDQKNTLMLGIEAAGLLSPKGPSAYLSVGTTLGSVAVDIGLSSARINSKVKLALDYTMALNAAALDNSKAGTTVLEALAIIQQEISQPKFLRVGRVDACSVEVDLGQSNGVEYLLPGIKLAQRSGSLRITNAGPASSSIRAVVQSYFSPNSEIEEDLRGEILPVSTDYKGFAGVASGHAINVPFSHAGFSSDIVSRFRSSNVVKVNVFSGFTHCYSRTTRYRLLGFGAAASDFPKSSDTKYPHEFVSSVAGRDGRLTPRQIQEAIGESRLLHEGSLSAVTQSSSLMLRLPADLVEARLVASSADGVSLLLLIEDSTGLRVGVSSQDGVQHGELLGRDEDNPGHEASVTLIDPLAGEYRVTVALQEPDNASHPFSVYLESTPRASTPLLATDESPLVVLGKPGESVVSSLIFGEVSQQFPLTNLLVNTSPVSAWNGSDQWLGSTVPTAEVIGTLAAGQSKSVHLPFAISPEQQPGKYLASVTATTNELPPLTVPVLLVVRHGGQLVTQFEGPLPELPATTQKTLQLDASGYAETFVVIQAGEKVVHGYTGLTGGTSGIANPSIDLGGDGTIDWTFSGLLSEGVLINNIEGPLNHFIENNAPHNGAYRIPIILHGPANGSATFNGVQLFTDVAPPRLDLSANVLNFGTHVVNRASASRPLSLTNNGETFLPVLQVETTEGFQQSNDCGMGLPRGGSCTITLTFVAENIGLKAGTLRITYGSDNSVSVPLSGTGMDFSVRTIRASRPARTSATTSQAFVVHATSGLAETVSLSCTTPRAECYVDKETHNFIEGTSEFIITLKPIPDRRSRRLNPSNSLRKSYDVTFSIAGQNFTRSFTVRLDH